MEEAMNYRYLFLLMLLPGILFSVSIKDIQYTSDSGFDGTYPSSLYNQIVKTEGIVTALGSNSDRYYISDSQGGPWSSICIIDNKSNVALGQYVRIEGKVSEYLGMTCIRAYSSKLIKSNCSLPEPYPITIGELNNSEAYESVLVKINNVTLIKSSKIEFPYSIENLNSQGFVGNNFNLVKQATRSQRITQQNLNQIVGLVVFSNNRFSINPRNSSDIVYQGKGTQSTSWGKIKSLYR